MNIWPWKTIRNLKDLIAQLKSGLIAAGANNQDMFERLCRAEEVGDKKGARADELQKRLDVEVACDVVDFQRRVEPWMAECFGAETSNDAEERNHRFIEEALELVQACNGTAEDCHELVDYVFGRPVGLRGQEVGGVMVTLAALCLAQRLDMHGQGDVELKRVWGRIDQIRRKQETKPHRSPLPMSQEPPSKFPHSTKRSPGKP